MLTISPEPRSSGSPHIGANPYIVNNLVGGTDAFIGRTDILRSVFHLLTTPNESILVLNGQRRSGKTSILKELAVRLPEAGYYRPISFDLQDKAGLPLNRILVDLANQLSQELDLPQHDRDNDIQVVFRDEFLPRILAHLPSDMVLVFLLDEFQRWGEAGSEKASLGTALFLYLRDLIVLSPPRIKFIFTVGRNPEDFSRLSQSVFNGVRVQHIGLFSFEETETLIHLAEQNQTLQWSDEAVQAIYNLTNGHPYFTQQICWEVWEQAYQNPPPGTPLIQGVDVEDVLASALRNASNALEWIWDGLGSAEQLVAAAIAQVNIVAPTIVSRASLDAKLKQVGVWVIISELQNAPSILQKWDIIETVDREGQSGYKFQVEMFRRWLVKYKPINKLRQDIDRIQPMAERLFHESQQHYDQKEFEQAVPKLRQVLGFNPNHVQATMLLVEILLAQDEISSAQELLENLYEYQPDLARPRLIQTLLQTVNQTFEEDQKLGIYERILKIAPDHPEALAARAHIWERRGDAAASMGNLEAALEAYQQANRVPSSASSDQALSLEEKRQRIKQQLAHQQFSTRLEQVRTLENRGQYQEALALARQLSQEFPDQREHLPNLENLERRSRLDTLYQQGLLALQDGDRLKAQDNLRQVVSMDPNYQDATRYLHLLATGVDMTYLHYQLEQQQWAIQRAEARAWTQGRQVRHTRRKQRQQERTLFMATFGSVSLVLVILCMVLLSVPVAFQAFIWANSPSSAAFTGTINDGSLEQSLPSLPVAQATNDQRATAFAIAAAVDRPTATFTSLPTEAPTATPMPTDTPTPTPAQIATAALSTNLSITDNSPLPTPTPEPTNTDTPAPTDTATTIVLMTATPTPTKPTVAGGAGVFGTQLSPKLLSLLTYEFKAPQIPVKPGNEVTVQLEWEVLERMDEDYHASVQLLTQIDGPWLPSFGQSDLPLESGGQPTSQWTIGQKIKIDCQIELRHDARSGIYRVAVVVYNPAEPTQTRMRVVPGETTGRMGDDILILQETTVE